MRGVKQQTKLHIPKSLLEESLKILKLSTSKEKVLIWFGKMNSTHYLVEEVFTPIQEAEQDYFFIPQEGMNEIFQRIKSTRRMMVAQIHTHPRMAFHSAADDRWAIVRHQNAYSLVLPFFCSTTTIENFQTQVATYTLDKVNSWRKVHNKNIVII